MSNEQDSTSHTSFSYNNESPRKKISKESKKNGDDSVRAKRSVGDAKGTSTYDEKLIFACEELAKQTSEKKDGFDDITVNKLKVKADHIKNLIENHANVNGKNKSGDGTLHIVAKAYSDYAKLYNPEIKFKLLSEIVEILEQIIRELLKKNAEVNMTNKRNETPLHIAAEVNCPQIVETLILNKANKEAETKIEMQTPMHFAARFGSIESLKVLQKADANIEARDHKLRTPLFVATELCQSRAARCLIEMHADAKVLDKSGQMCLTQMITKMAPVAWFALDQFYERERASRNQTFQLYELEVFDAEKVQQGVDQKNSTINNQSDFQTILTSEAPSSSDSINKSTGRKVLAKTPLEEIVRIRQLDLIMHPVIRRLINVKWEQFGRTQALIRIGLDFVSVLTWTILGIAYPWYLRPFYTFPTDGWRVFLLVFGSVLAVYELVTEIWEIYESRKKHKKWKKWREEDLEEDKKNCHPERPEEKEYIRDQMTKLDKAIPGYFKDFWNLFDWAIFGLVLMVVVFHIADAALHPSLRQPPCCTVDFVCADTNPNVCNTGRVNNASLSVWTNRFFVLLIILLWLRLMKFTRAFRFLGPFIAMFEKLSKNVVRFLYLYLEFYIPYACAFWMIFGYTTTVTSMSTVDQMLFSLFRITLVDEYQFDEMHAYDIAMAYILIGTFLGFSAILLLNLFIALLTDTFQRVYDNAKANAMMQQAIHLVSFEDKKSKKKFCDYLLRYCNPEKRNYDDDLSQEEDVDLRKFTIEVKEQLDQLTENVNKLSQTLEQCMGKSYEESDDKKNAEAWQPIVEDEIVPKNVRHEGENCDLLKKQELQEELIRSRKPEDGATETPKNELPEFPSSSETYTSPRKKTATLSNNKVFPAVQKEGGVRFVEINIQPSNSTAKEETNA